MSGAPRPGGGKKTQVLAALRGRIETIERPRLASDGAAALSFGVAAVDRALPEGGLRPAGLHEFLGEAGALALVAALAARRLADGAAGPVFWCLERALPYPPGLAAFGLGPERLILVRARDGREVLWAMEEALGSGRAALVVGWSRGEARWLGPCGHHSVSSPRSSNRTCGFPASGFPTGFTSKHTAVGQDGPDVIGSHRNTTAGKRLVQDRQSPLLGAPEVDVPASSDHTDPR